MYAVTVTFKIKPDLHAAFLRLIAENACTSLATEPGCYRFDVCTDSERPDEVFLYELYADRGAFDAHLESQHYGSFDTQARDMIQSKTVATYDRVLS